MADWEYLRVDELSEGVFCLQVTQEMIGQVGEDPYYWEWVILALHSALQAFMVCALRSTNYLRLLTKKNAEAWLNAYEKGLPLPKERLAPFMKLYGRVKCDDHMMMYSGSRALEATQEQDRSVERLHLFRNRFVHFLPMDWCLQLAGLANMAANCIGVVRFLAFNCGNVLWTRKDDLRARCSESVEAIEAAFAGM